MKRLRIRYDIAIDDLPWPSGNITYDSSNRIDAMQYQYGSICVKYQNTWATAGAEIASVTETITDGVCS